MRKVAILVLIVFSLGVFLASYVWGERLPAGLVVKDFEGREFDFEALRGRRVVLVVFASSMPDCRKSMLKLAELSRKWKGPETLFLAVDVSPPRMASDSPFGPWESEKVIVLRDERGDFARKLSIKLIPTTLIISRDGSVLDKLEAFTDWGSLQFMNKLLSLFGEGERTGG